MNLPNLGASGTEWTVKSPITGRNVRSVCLGVRGIRLPMAFPDKLACVHKVAPALHE